MPPKATKNWGQANRDILVNLTNRKLIDITDTTHQNIKQVRDLHFRHRNKRKSAIISEIIQQRGTSTFLNSSAQCNGGKMRCLILMIFLPARTL